MPHDRCSIHSQHATMAYPHLLLCLIASCVIVTTCYATSDAALPTLRVAITSPTRGTTVRASAASPDRKVPLQVVVSVVVNGANAGVVGRGRPSGVGNAPGELVLETSSAYSTAAEAWEYEVPPTPFANNVRHFALPRALQAALRSSTTPATSTFNLTAMVPTPKHGVYHMTARVRWLPTADAFIDVPANAEAGVGSDGSQVPATRLLHPSHLLQQHMTGGLSLSNTASSFVHVTTSGHASHAWLRSLEDKQVVKQLGKAGRVAAELEELNAKRQDLATRYVALNEELWDMDLSWMLDPKLVEAVESGSRAAMASLLHREAASGVWTLDVFSPSFCERLLEELDFANTQTLLNFSRPNTMNNYGIVLEELGLSQLLDELMHKYLAPLADLVFPEWGGASLDHHHSFTIRYRHGEDLDLAQHMDASDVTLNVCLGDEFTGAEVYFRGVRDAPWTEHEDVRVTHTPGRALLHVGQHFHGAHQLTSGQRRNLVIWMKSSEYRSSPAERFFHQH